MSASRIVPILLASIGLAAGCEPIASNRSPTSEQDPDRYARARRDAEESHRENQEAEARFSQRIGLDPPVDAPEPPDDFEIANNQTNEGNS